MTDQRPPSAPAWVPDPSGRHQLRWHDGFSLTDQVADDGVVSTDPGSGPVPAPPPPAEAPARRTTKLPVVLAALGAFVVVLAVLILLAGDDDGTGTFEGTVSGDGPVRHEVSVDAGTVLVVEVSPGADLDAVVGFAVDPDVGDRIADLYEGTPIESFAAEHDDGTMFRVDVGFDGEDELTFLPAAFDVDAAVVVRGFEGSEGSYEVRIEAFDLDVDDDADGDELLAAVASADGVPRTVREIVGGG